MGETSTSVEREIDLLRRETTWIIDELEHRAKHAFDLRAQAADHRYVAAGVGVAVIAGIAAIVYGRRQPQHREAFQRPRAIWGPLRWEAGERMRDVGEMKSKGMPKRVMWSMLAAVIVATAAFVAKRFSARLWEATFRERPPEKVS